MIYVENLWLYVCVSVSSLVLYNSCTRGDRIDEAAAGDIPLPHSRFARDTDRTETKSVQTATAVPSEQRHHDDRLYFEIPDWFKSINIHEESTPDRLNTNTDTDDASFTVDGAYKFRVRLEDGTIHAERGAYEFLNGKRVFVIRGYFRNISPTGKLQMTSSPYIFNNTGFHRLPDTQTVEEF